MINNFTIDGLLLKEPDMRRTQSGTPICTSRIVHHDEPGDPGLFINIAAWQESAALLQQFHKGQMVVLVGKLSSHTWKDTDGKKHEEFELKVETLGKAPRQPKPKKKSCNPIDYMPDTPEFNALREQLKRQQDDPDYSIDEITD